MNYIIFIFVINESILNYAVEKGFYDVVTILLERKVTNVNQKDIIIKCIYKINIALQLAIEKNSTELVQLLLTNPSIDVNIKIIFLFLCFYIISNIILNSIDHLK